jgi:hypothetical protein
VRIGTIGFVPLIGSRLAVAERTGGLPRAFSWVDDGGAAGGVGSLAASSLQIDLTAMIADRLAFGPMALLTIFLLLAVRGGTLNTFSLPNIGLFRPMSMLVSATFVYRLYRFTAEASCAAIRNLGRCCRSPRGPTYLQRNWFLTGFAPRRILPNPFVLGTV